MEVLIFIRDLFRKFPFLLVSSTLVVVGQGLIGTLSIFTIALHNEETLREMRVGLRV